MRLKMKKLLNETTQRNTDVEIMPFNAVDESLLAALFYESYKGSVDDEGETAEDWQEIIQAFKQGDFGELLTSASFVLKNIQNELISAIVIGLEDGIAYVISLVTHPTQRGKQLAEELLNLSMNQLIGNFNELVLYVNEENVGAIRLYERMGFIVEGKQ